MEFLIFEILTNKVIKSSVFLTLHERMNIATRSFRGHHDCITKKSSEASMDQIQIYVTDNSECLEFEAESRGCRFDVYVKFSDELFSIKIYDIVRLTQDFESEVASKGFYSVDPNVVLVPSVTNTHICTTVMSLAKQKYFSQIKPLCAQEVEKIMKDLSPISLPTSFYDNGRLDNREGQTAKVPSRFRERECKGAAIGDIRVKTYDCCVWHCG